MNGHVLGVVQGVLQERHLFIMWPAHFDHFRRAGPARCRWGLLSFLHEGIPKGLPPLLCCGHCTFAKKGKNRNESIALRFHSDRQAGILPSVPTNSGEIFHGQFSGTGLITLEHRGRTAFPTILVIALLTRILFRYTRHHLKSSSMRQHSKCTEQ